MSSEKPIESQENPRLRLELNPGRLSEIIGAAVFASTSVVNLHLDALSEDNLKRSAHVGGISYLFRGPDLTVDERRALHESWILARAFQELLRAVRHSLEEAYTFSALLTKEHKIRSSSSLEEFLAPFQKKAAALSFPELLAVVNRYLDPKLEFAESYRSLQAARNCLEHRAGVIGHVDMKGSPEFKLIFPRMKVFYLRGVEEIELAIGERVDAGDDRSEVDVFMRFEIRRRSVQLGQRLTFTPIEFSEIAFACNHLGQQLAARLPKPKLVTT